MSTINFSTFFQFRSTYLKNSLLYCILYSHVFFVFLTPQLFPPSCPPGPCIPEHITTQYSLMIGQVLWDRTAGADYYMVEGITEQGLTGTCITNDTYCVLYNLKCGQSYNVTVTANNRVCQGVSISTEAVMITTGDKTH